MTGQLEAWHVSATGGDRPCGITYANSVERFSSIESEINSPNANLKRLDQSLGDRVPTQYFLDGLCAGIEGGARNSVEHLEKLEGRIAAGERNHKTSQDVHPAT